MTITSDDMEKLNRAQIAALVQKLKSGTPLSSAQMKMLEEARKAGEDIPNAKVSKYPAHTKSDPKMRDYIRESFSISEVKAYGWIRKLRAMKSKSAGWDVARVLQVIADRKESAVSGGGVNNDLKREMMKRQIAILKLKEDEQAGRLVAIDKVMDEQRRLIAGYRGAIESWRQYTIAKHPAIVNDIEAAADNLIRMMLESIHV